MMNRTHTRTRRAGILVAVMILLVWVNLAVISAVTASGNDSQASVWQMQSLSAHWAAESGINIALFIQKKDNLNPATGTITLPNGVVVTIVTPFAAGPTAPPGELKVSASVGQAQRVATLALTAQPND